ncbi:hypothetical protein BH23BAC3_BH23BAC3_09540 [soil metagenome]
MNELEYNLFIESLPFHTGWIIVLLVGSYTLYKQTSWHKKSSITNNYHKLILSIILLNLVGSLSVFINFYLMYLISRYIIYQNNVNPWFP